MTKPKIGLLPLYLELYDRALPSARPRIEAFYATITSELGKKGLDVLTTAICRLKNEFAAAIKSFEEAGADCIVTLHLAYSPSLESAEALAKTKLPIIVLDTTPAYSYGPQQDPDELIYNHGIHGVQDMCNMLIRNRKPFQIEAGHWGKSDVLDRISAWARVARIASRMRNARVGRIGKPFEGMGDFAVPDDVLRSTIGIEVVQCDPKVIKSLVPPQDDPVVEEEIAADLERFSADGVDPAAHRRSVRAGLAVRRWIEQKKLTAFTFNFLDIDRASGLPTVPFLEASKGMAREVGYAGEGDVLTAAFVGALASIHQDTTFTEMFCPNWEEESIFLNHMGEMNTDLAVGKAVLVEKPMPWIDADPPVIAVGRFRGGNAVFLNLAPGPENAYTLIAAPITVLDVEGDEGMANSVRGWFRPAMPIADFLKEYSRAGGTHHAAMVYGDVAEDMIRFGKLMGWKTLILANPQ